MRPLGILWVVLTLLLAVGVGVAAYQYGLHDGLSQEIQNLPANTVPAPGYGYPYYYGHWGWGFGFPFFPILPLFGFLFFLLIVFALFRAFARPWRWYGGPRGPYGHGPGGHLDDWHRRAHEAEGSGAQPKQ